MINDEDWFKYIDSIKIGYKYEIINCFKRVLHEVSVSSMFKLCITIIIFEINDKKLFIPPFE